jgi:DNA sulfur modification protein DndB
MSEKKKARQTMFVETIKSFLERLEFNDVKGGKEDFKINGIKIDVCGGSENALIIVKCVTSQDLENRSIISMISEIRGNAELIRKGIANHPVYKKYTYIVHVLAAKNVEIRKNDIDFANYGKPRVYIWDDNFIEYYEDLYDKIKKYSKFNLLGEMGVKPLQKNPISVPAFRYTYGRTKMYTFLIDPHDLLEVSYVARREARGERFYQRLIKKDRLNKISRYINDTNNILPNNLIIAFGEPGSKFVRFDVLENSYKGKCTSGIDVSYGILQFPREYRSCWIIDGQHRLYAFADAQRKVYIPVTAFQDLEIEKQCKIFLDINKNQKPVPPDLVWDLNGEMIPSEEDGIISNVVKSLNDGGPLYHKIRIPSKGIRKKENLLKMAGVCISIKKMRLVRQNTLSKTANPFYDPEPSKMVSKLSKGLSDYFTCVKEVLNEDWKLANKGFVLDDGGNSVMIRLFEKIVSRCVDKGEPTKDDYKKYLEPLAELLKNKYSNKEEFKKIKLNTASEGGKDELLREFVMYIKNKTNDPLFGGIMETQAIREIKRLESRLKELVKIVLSKEAGENWFEDKIPDDIKGKAKKRTAEKGLDTAKAYQQMTFGDAIQIIKNYRSLFYPIFTRGSHGFHGSADLEAAFTIISSVRTEETHPDSGDKKLYDEDLFKIYLDKINRCIDPIIS